MENIREKAIAIYKKCSEYALEKGVIVLIPRWNLHLIQMGN